MRVSLSGLTLPAPFVSRLAALATSPASGGRKLFCDVAGGQHFVWIEAHHKIDDLG
jgi:hypothetical protein